MDMPPINREIDEVSFTPDDFNIPLRQPSPYQSQQVTGASQVQNKATTYKKRTTKQDETRVSLANVNEEIIKLKEQLSILQNFIINKMSK